MCANKITFTPLARGVTTESVLDGSGRPTGLYYVCKGNYLDVQGVAELDATLREKEEQGDLAFFEHPLDLEAMKSEGCLEYEDQSLHELAYWAVKQTLEWPDMETAATAAMAADAVELATDAELTSPATSPCPVVKCVPTSEQTTPPWTHALMANPQCPRRQADPPVRYARVRNPPKHWWKASGSGDDEERRADDKGKIPLHYLPGAVDVQENRIECEGHADEGETAATTRIEGDGDDSCATPPGLSVSKPHVESVVEEACASPSEDEETCATPPNTPTGSTLPGSTPPSPLTETQQDVQVALPRLSTPLHAVASPPMAVDSPLREDEADDAAADNVEEEGDAVPLTAAVAFNSARDTQREDGWFRLLADVHSAGERLKELSTAVEGILNTVSTLNKRLDIIDDNAKTRDETTR